MAFFPFLFVVFVIVFVMFLFLLYFCFLMFFDGRNIGQRKGVLRLRMPPANLICITIKLGTLTVE
jgi:hypothetical protein